MEGDETKNEQLLNQHATKVENKDHNTHPDTQNKFGVKLRCIGMSSAPAATLSDQCIALTTSKTFNSHTPHSLTHNKSHSKTHIRTHKHTQHTNIHTQVNICLHVLVFGIRTNQTLTCHGQRVLKDITPEQHRKECGVAKEIRDIVLVQTMCIGSWWKQISLQCDLVTRR